MYFVGEEEAIMNADWDAMLNPDLYDIIHREINLLRRNNQVDIGVPTHTEDGIPIRKLYVSNLPPKTTRTEIFGLFAQYGFIKSCWLRMGDRDQIRSDVPAYAFVTFSDPVDAYRALTAPIQEKMLRGRRLKILPADSWHQPVEDAEGRICWKPQSQHYSNNNNAPSVANGQNLVDNNPEAENSSNNLDNVESDSEQYNILQILNSDCLTHILKYVSIIDLIRSERVSKGWQTVVQEYLESTRLFKTSWWPHNPLPMTTAVLRRVLQRLGPGLLRLHIDHHWSALNDRTAHIIGKFCPNLEQIKVVGMHTKNWNPLIYGCKELKDLSFISCSKLTDASLVNLVKAESSLEKLTISNNTHVTGLFLTGSKATKLSSLAFYSCYSLQATVLCAAMDTLPNLTTLKLDVCPTNMWKIVPQILDKLPELLELSLSEYTSVEICLMPLGDDSFCKAISKLNKLKVLNLSRNIYITNTILKQIGQSCPMLESLNISSCNPRPSYQCTGINDEGVVAVCAGCTMLQHLDVSYLAALTDTGLAAAACLRQLSTLISHGNPNLTTIPFISIVSQCLKLKEVDACGCSGVSEDVIMCAVKAVETCPRTLVLRLAGTAAVTVETLRRNAECPAHKLLAVNLHEDRSDPHLRPDFVDTLYEDSSEESYDGFYDGDIDFDRYFGQDEDFLDEEDMDDYEHMELFVQMPHLL